jgi:hypothetical protein
MNTPGTTTPQNTPQQAPSLKDMEEALVESSESLMRASRQRFEELHAHVAQRITGTVEGAQEALASGSFFVNESTVVIRYDEDLTQVEIFCDVGLPEPYAENSVYRAALEYNLCCTYPGVSFGIHPDSGRLVATTALLLSMLTDDEMCLNTVQMLTDLAQEVRHTLRLGGS